MESQIQHRFPESDLDLHCFPMSHKEDTRHTKKGNRGREFDLGPVAFVCLI